MGLNKYRTYKDRYIDDGLEVLEIVTSNFNPDFYNRNTIQIWDLSSTPQPKINKWKGVTLTDRTLHEITIVNNSNEIKYVEFTTDYVLSDEITVDVNDRPNLIIGARGSAYFYCTAIFIDGTLELDMRTGSQDDKKI